VPEPPDSGVPREWVDEAREAIRENCCPYSTGPVAPEVLEASRLRSAIRFTRCSGSGWSQPWEMLWRSAGPSQTTSVLVKWEPHPFTVFLSLASGQAGKPLHATRPAPASTTAAVEMPMATPAKTSNGKWTPR
jgi:hypothetical protein